MYYKFFHFLHKRNSGTEVESLLSANKVKTFVLPFAYVESNKAFSSYANLKINLSSSDDCSWINCIIFFFY